MLLKRPGRARTDVEVDLDLAARLALLAGGGPRSVITRTSHSEAQ